MRAGYRHTGLIDVVFLNNLLLFSVNIINRRSGKILLTLIKYMWMQLVFEIKSMVWKLNPRIEFRKTKQIIFLMQMNFSELAYFLLRHVTRQNQVIFVVCLTFLRFLWVINAWYSLNLVTSNNIRVSTNVQQQYLWNSVSRVIRPLPNASYRLF